jgi:hypothetical protein
VLADGLDTSRDCNRRKDKDEKDRHHNRARAATKNGQFWFGRIRVGPQKAEQCRCARLYAGLDEVVKVNAESGALMRDEGDGQYRTWAKLGSCPYCVGVSIDRAGLEGPGTAFLRRGMEPAVAVSIWRDEIRPFWRVATGRASPWLGRSGT